MAPVVRRERPHLNLVPQTPVSSPTPPSCFFLFIYLFIYLPQNDASCTQLWILNETASLAYALVTSEYVVTPRSTTPCSAT